MAWEEVLGKAGLVGWEFVIFAILVLLFLIVAGVTAFIILNRLRWNFKVNILENVAGKGYVIAGKDKARLIAFGDGGEEIFLLKHRKKYRVGYGKRIGTRVIAWAIGQDGYWYNITFGDLDSKLQELGVVPVDRDMRFSTSSLRKGIENRYNEKTWMDKYGTIMYFGLFVLTLLIFGGVMWFAFNKQIQIANINSKSMETTKEVMELAKQVLNNIDNVKNGGSGIKPA